MNLASRRDVLIGSAAMLLASAARAAAATNADILSCYMTIDQTPIRFDKNLSFISGLEAHQPCRVYVPLAWGNLRGFRLQVEDKKGKITEPAFHPPTDMPPPDMLGKLNNYLFMVPGTVIGMRTTVPAKSIFPSRGTFTLHQIYVPEPSRDITSVPYALVAENGPVHMPPKIVTVV